LISSVGLVGRAAAFAGVAVLVRRVAARAFALDVAVGQEHLLDRVEELLDRAHLDQAARLEPPVDLLRQHPVLLRVGRVVVVEADAEIGEVAQVLLLHARDQLLRRDALLLGAQHHRRAVGVVGAHIVAFVPAHLLEAHPDVGLDVFHQVPEVDRAVGVGQRAGDEDNSPGKVTLFTAIWLSTGMKRTASSCCTASSQASVSIESAIRPLATNAASSHDEMAEMTISPSANSVWMAACAAVDNLLMSPVAHQIRMCVSSTITSGHPSPSRISVQRGAS
jgi:hypothetical protein